MTSRSSRRFSPARACLIAALPLLTSCVDGDYNKFRIYQEPLAEAVATLDPGVTDLGSALEALGAPVFVVEVGLGLALAWGWQDTTAWNIEVSGPIGDAQGQFQYSDSDQKTKGLVLFFDADWQLTSVRQGFLADLVPKRQRPRDVEDELGPDEVAP